MNTTYKLTRLSFALCLLLGPAARTVAQDSTVDVEEGPPGFRESIAPVDEPPTTAAPTEVLAPVTAPDSVRAPSEATTHTRVDATSHAAAEQAGGLGTQEQPPPTPSEPSSGERHISPTPAASDQDASVRTPPFYVRIYGGPGLTYTGGDVSATDEWAMAHAHVGGLVRMFALDFGFRPFLGAARLGVSVRGDTAFPSYVPAVSLGLSIDYDFLYWLDRTVDKEFSLAIGIFLGVGLTGERFLDATPSRMPQYILLAPHWAFYGEFRWQVERFHDFVVRVEFATGFDDISHVLNSPVTIGYMRSM